MSGTEGKGEVKREKGPVPDGKGKKSRREGKAKMPDCGPSLPNATKGSLPTLPHTKGSLCLVSYSR